MNIEGMRMLVTGGAGFIGSHLVDSLVPFAQHLTIVDDYSVGKPENLKQYWDNPRVRIIQADVRDLKAMSELMKDVDIVFHLAVRCLRLSLSDPLLVHEVNATGSLNMCLAALNSGVKRFIYLSSSEVYGTAQLERVNEEHPLFPTTPYGASKLAGEKYATSFWLTYGLPVIVVRPFNAYGPRAHSQGERGEVLPRFVTRALKGKPPIIFGDGLQTRDFTYVKDTARGIVLAAQCDDLVGGIVNIASGREASIIDLSRLVIKKLNKNGLEPHFEDARPGDIRRHCADITLAQKMLGYNPEYTLGQGVDEYIEWFVNSSLDLSDADSLDTPNWSFPAHGKTN